MPLFLAATGAGADQGTGAPEIAIIDGTRTLATAPLDGADVAALRRILRAGEVVAWDAGEISERFPWVKEEARSLHCAMRRYGGWRGNAERRVGLAKALRQSGAADPLPPGAVAAAEATRWIWSLLDREARSVPEARYRVAGKAGVAATIGDPRARAALLVCALLVAGAATSMLTESVAGAMAGLAFFFAAAIILLMRLRRR